MSAGLSLSWRPQVLLLASHRLTLDLWLAKDNRFLNSKSSYGRILTAPPCRLIRLFVTFLPDEDNSWFILKDRQKITRMNRMFSDLEARAIRYLLNPKSFHGSCISNVLWKVNKFMKRARGLATPMKGSSSRPAKEKMNRQMNPSLILKMHKRFHQHNLRHLPRFPDFFVTFRIFSPSSGLLVHFRFSARRLQPVNHE